MEEKKQGWSDDVPDSRFRRIVERASKFYRTYTSGLKAGDFKRLFTLETKGIYSHFQQSKQAKPTRSRFKDAMRAIGEIFWGFLLSMSAARRILYGIAFLIFAISAIVILTAPYGSAIRQDVATLAIYSFIIASFLLALELADKLSARDEIEIAREVQLSLLPPSEPKLPGLKTASFSAPAADVGGDYYDFAFINGRVCLAIGDVSGHGLGSGLLMAMAKSAWQAQLINDPQPSRVLSTLNKIVRDAGNSRTLMTFLHCVLENESRELKFSNAGHIYPLHIKAASGDATWLESQQAYPLGVRVKQKYETCSVHLGEGDLLCFISDGVVESINKDGESFGYQRFLNSAQKNREGEPHEILERIIEDLQKFVKDSAQEDDMTIIIARYLPY